MGAVPIAGDTGGAGHQQELGDAGSRGPGGAGYLHRTPAPTLRPGQMVMLEHEHPERGSPRYNPSPDRRGGLAAGRPAPGSPDFNPIALACAWGHAGVAGRAAWAAEAVVTAAGDALATVTATDARRCYRASGYP